MFSNKIKGTRFLSLSGIRGAKSISVYNFSAQQLASSGNQRTFNFRVMAVRHIHCKAMNAFVEKYILIL